MAIKLGTGEVLKASTKFHWTYYLAPAIWASIWLAATIIILFSPNPYKLPLSLAMLGFCLYPLFKTYLTNKNTVYAVTNERIYIEQGILAKSKKDIPLDKINDFEIRQSFIQRFYDSGDILFLTGNNKEFRMRNIANLDEFREAVTSLIAHRKQ
jgi:uncharacterized membrane protein YdbT with pleckstrin-like domain